jgi:hypothetical protein
MYGDCRGAGSSAASRIAISGLRLGSVEVNDIVVGGRSCSSVSSSLSIIESLATPVFGGTGGGVPDVTMQSCMPLFAVTVAAECANALVE